jgi:hypothetical protein
VRFLKVKQEEHQEKTMNERLHEKVWYVQFDCYSIEINSSYH